MDAHQICQNASNGNGISANASFLPRLTTTDWNEEWKKIQRLRHHADDANHWNKRARSFSSAYPPSSYAQDFIKKMGLLPGETIFDMGAGTGALSVPLGALGHNVLAADFSSNMLAEMQIVLDEQHIHCVDTLLLSWEEDWRAKGVAPQSFDVAVASRSIGTGDLKDSIEKLSAVARRRCCLTLPTGPSPRIDMCILEALGLGRSVFREHLYAIMILNDLGFNPEVSYIKSQRDDVYASFEEAYDNLAKMITDATTIGTCDDDIARAKLALGPWLKENLVKHTTDTPLNSSLKSETTYVLKQPRVVTWAFIAWNKSDS